MKRVLLVILLLGLSLPVYAATVDLSPNGSGSFATFSPSTDTVDFGTIEGWLVLIDEVGITEAPELIDGGDFINLNNFAQNNWTQDDIAALEDYFLSLGFTQEEMELLTDPFFHDPATIGPGYPNAIDAFEAAFIEVFKRYLTVTLSNIVMDQIVTNVSTTSPTSPKVRMSRTAVLGSALSFVTPGTVSTNTAGVVFFYEEGDIGDLDTKSYGGTPVFSFSGGKADITVGLPIQKQEYKIAGFKADIDSIGLDLSARYNFESFRVGFHGNYTEYDYDDDFNSDNFSSHTVGAFAGSSLSITDSVDWGLGAILDYTKFNGINSDLDADDEGVLGGLATNVGISLSESFVCNPFAIYWKEFDAENDLDDDFYDLGLDFGIALSSNWMINVGAKTTLGYENESTGDDYDNYETFLGATFGF